MRKRTTTVLDEVNPFAGSINYSKFYVYVGLVSYSLNIRVRTNLI